ncbi:MAG: hypothetical protein QOE45_1322 [Frankiaceae bacterium]|nr:hypothetical protein [Frankiaceae bacterium]
MPRILLVAAACAALVLGSAGAASAHPGGSCEGVVDVFCRGHVCQPDELDCGLVPPCVLWVAGVCLY